MTQKKKRLLFSTYITIFMVSFALSGTMFSTVLPDIIDDYKLAMTQASLFTIISSIGHLLTQFAMAVIGDFFKKGPFIGVMYVLMGVMLFLVGTHPSFILLLVFMACMNIFSNAINLMTTAYMSDLYGDDRGKYINLLHMFFGLGSLLGPSFPIFIMSRGYDWNIAYRVLAVIVLVLGASYFVCMYTIREPEMAVVSHKDIVGGKSASFLDMMKMKGMIPLSVVSFLYMAGHQGAFSTWLQTFLQKQDIAVYTPEYTSLLMTAYWIGMAASRLVVAAIGHKVKPRIFLISGGTFGTILLLIGLLLNAKGMWLVTCIGLGLATGAQYPLTLSIASDLFPKNSARVISLTSIFSSIGSILFGGLIGWMAEHVSFYLTMFIPVVTLGVVTLIVKFLYPHDHRAHIA